MSINYDASYHMPYSIDIDVPRLPPSLSQSKIDEMKHWCRQTFGLFSESVLWSFTIKASGYTEYTVWFKTYEDAVTFQISWI